MCIRDSHDTLELDGDRGLLGDGQLLVEGDGGSLCPLIVANVGGLEGLGGLGMVDGDLGVRQLELEGVESDLLGGLDNLRVDAVRRQSIGTRRR